MREGRVVSSQKAERAESRERGAHPPDGGDAELPVCLAGRLRASDLLRISI